jgi:hypothetical protein
VCQLDHHQDALALMRRQVFETNCEESCLVL